MELENKYQTIRASLPDEGLFDAKDWRVAESPFPLSAKFVRELESFGRVLSKFYASISQLYRFSKSGREPEWVSEWLDLGIPKDLIELQLHKKFNHQIPRVIRPDILLTEDGWAITELDSVPGGIGLTAWLNRTYHDLGYDVIGGSAGMISGFSGIFSSEYGRSDSGKIHLTVSDEAATYRPEMHYLARCCNEFAEREKFFVQDERYQGFQAGDSIYRFFELFDLGNIPSSDSIFQMAQAGDIEITPPPRPIMEEKMNLALLWNRNLEDFWIREMGKSFFEKMKRVAPRSWVMDPAPVPPHASIAGMDLTSWHQMKGLSQKKRNFIIKVSGYSEDAWGARGVYLGSDMSGEEWSGVIDMALRSFKESPYILQEFRKPSQVATSWITPDSYESVPMKARVRLCPYYFVHGSLDKPEVKLSGILATLCPADKKIIHGMSDAVLAPCMVAT